MLCVIRVRYPPPQLLEPPHLQQFCVLACFCPCPAKFQHCSSIIKSLSNSYYVGSSKVAMKLQFFVDVLRSGLMNERNCYLQRTIGE